MTNSAKTNTTTITTTITPITTTTTTSTITTSTTTTITTITTTTTTSTITTTTTTTITITTTTSTMITTTTTTTSTITTTTFITGDVLVDQLLVLFATIFQFLGLNQYFVVARGCYVLQLLPDQLISSQRVVAPRQYVPNLFWLSSINFHYRSIIGWNA